MGIPKCRFIERNHEQFICAICLDVAIDPVLVNSDTDCEHLFCKACIELGVARCPSCNGRFQDPKWNVIKGAVKRVYVDLRIKCLNPSCVKILTPSDYKYHDENCSITFEICEDCGFRSRRGPNSDHSCIQVLKAEQVASNKKIGQLEQIIQSERKRTEYLIYICMRFRRGYHDDHENPFSFTLDDLYTSLDYHKEIVEWFDKEFKKKYGINE